MGTSSLGGFIFLLNTAYPQSPGSSRSCGYKSHVFRCLSPHAPSPASPSGLVNTEPPNSSTISDLLPPVAMWSSPSPLQSAVCEHWRQVRRSALPRLFAVSSSLLRPYGSNRLIHWTSRGPP